MHGAMKTKKSTDKPTRKARLAGFVAIAMLAAGCSKPVDDRASEAPKEAAPASEKETSATASVQAKASPESGGWLLIWPTVVSVQPAHLRRSVLATKKRQIGFVLTATLFRAA